MLVDGGLAPGANNSSALSEEAAADTEVMMITQLNKVMLIPFSWSRGGCSLMP